MLIWLGRQKNLVKENLPKDLHHLCAREIRQAGYEFEKMRKRITIHLNQRSEMLSGISHDLRTPLTRLKLQLAMLTQQDLAKKNG